MASARLGDITGVKEEVVKKACSTAMKAQKSPEKLYLVDKSRGSSEVVFGFPGSWSAGDWFSRNPFGETKIDQLELFCPTGNDKVATSLRSIGTDELATVNQAFLNRFESILSNYSLQNEVEKALGEKKQIVFTGHSSGGAVAMGATVWFLEKYLKPENTRMPPFCVTFGSPLVGDRVLNHALRRENWSQFFLHFVMRYDIVPRVLLSPSSSIEREFQQCLSFLNPKITISTQECIKEASEFFVAVMRNASMVSSHAACQLMGNTNPLLETMANFVELSPYKPFGTFVFCTGNGKLVVVKNPDAILQLLFFSLQLSSETEVVEIACRTLTDHFSYQNELQESLNMQNVTYLDSLEGLPLSSDATDAESMMIDLALNDLRLSTRARLCLRAAGEAEKQKLRNQKRIEDKKTEIEKGLAMLEEYKTRCEARKVGYYDAFKISKNVDDFNANVKRLELAGIWDEIIEMLKRDDLPDGFESQKDWVLLGTRYRHIVEPLDIANYYRHSKNEDTGPYLMRGRPKRYRFTQRWREHALRMPAGSSSESCFWAEVEELYISSQGAFEDVKERILILEMKVEEWIRNGELGKDVLLEDSTFVKWWKTLPHQHKSVSRVKGLINT
ncbi:hypothetical protein SLE2022_375740 [Rubroshorea leprosula]